LCARHDSGRGHPERPERLKAVLDGIEAAGMSDAVVPITPRPAARDELERVHPAAYLDAMERFCRSGGGAIDLDTAAGERSWDAAMVAAGAGVDAVERLRAGEADAAFVAVRPPGHHATAARAMGFCLVNNVAVVAASLAASGERVLIVDYDAHHGNGTQDAFWTTSQVAYVSVHEWPQYPGTGALSDIGDGDGRGATVNVPLPAGATGDVYLAALDEVVTPVAERFRPTWLVVSAGFDGHRADPLCDLGLSAGDFGEITARLCRLVPPGRRLVVLEGGYDLDALGHSSAAVVAALAGSATNSRRPERLTNGGPGRANVAAARRLHLGEPAPAPH
jgi:acetoin utilization deacetylase AcuC-like enzyme